MKRPIPLTIAKNLRERELCPSTQTLTAIMVAGIVILSIIGSSPVVFAQTASDPDVTVSTEWTQDNTNSNFVKMWNHINFIGSIGGDVNAYASNGTSRNVLRSLGYSQMAATSEFVFAYEDGDDDIDKHGALNNSGQLSKNNTGGDIGPMAGDSTNDVFYYRQAFSQDIRKVDKNFNIIWERNPGSGAVLMAVDESDERITVLTNGTNEKRIITYDTDGSVVRNNTISIKYAGRNANDGVRARTSELDVVENQTEDIAFYMNQQTVYKINIRNGNVEQTLEPNGQRFDNPEVQIVPQVTPDGAFVAIPYQSDGFGIFGTDELEKVTNISSIHNGNNYPVGVFQNPNDATGNYTFLTMRNDGVVGTNVSNLPSPFPSQRISGQVRNQQGDGISGATIHVKNTSTGNVETVQTNSGGFYEINKNDKASYELTASKDGFFNKTETVTLSGSDVTQDFVLEPMEDSLKIKTRNWLKHGQTTDYEVWFTEQFENGSERTRVVTDDTSVSSDNTSIVTVDQGRNEITATTNTNINNRTSLSATYVNGTETYEASQNVTVATMTIDNLKILPTVTAYSAALSDWTIFVLIIAAGMGIVGTRLSTAFGGLAFSQSVILAGWFGDFVPEGVTMASVFVAMFIGLNLAANVDYTVRQ